MGEKIFEVERVSEEEIILRLRTDKLKLLPDSTKAHMKIAGRELLLALRSLVDAAVESLEQKKEGKGKRRTKIEVE